MKEKTFYFDNLDGLRAIAALSVVFYHITHWFHFPNTSFFEGLKLVLSFGDSGGSLGVCFFFILSGFLITYLLFMEQEKNTVIHIPFFYLRRVLRIWPLYYLTIFIGFVIYPLILSMQGITHNENASVVLYTLFAVNFDHIYNGDPTSGILGVQWSVAIEEQFYLIWPLVFFYFSKKKYFPFLLVLVILVSELFFLKSTTWQIGYYHLIGNFRYLAFGGLLGYLCYFKKNQITALFNKTTPLVHAIIYIICLLLLFFQKKMNDSLPYYSYLSHLLPFLFFGYVIVEQNFSSQSFFKIGKFASLNWLGKISYGLYLIHMVAIYLVFALFKHIDLGFFGMEILATIGLTILLSYLSYTYFESYFLSLKSRFTDQIGQSKA